MMPQLKNKNSHKVLATEVIETKTFLQKAKGLLGKNQLEPGHVLWIRRCNSIHTWFMRFSIDVVFVDNQLQVTSTHENVKPWRLLLPKWRARSVFEFPAGSVGQLGIQRGDSLDVVD